MSKELTEQLQNGTLEEDFYYVKNKDCLGVEIDYYHVLHSGIKYWSGCEDEDVEEILTKVPTYQEHKEFENTISKLGEQLKEANDLLKGLYNDSPCQFDHHGYCQEHGSTDGNYICVQGELKEYLAKWGVK